MTRKNRAITKRRTARKNASINVFEQIWKSLSKSYGELKNAYTSEPLGKEDVDKIRQTPMYSSIPAKIIEEFERFGSYSGVKTAVDLPNGRKARVFFVECDASRKTNEHSPEQLGRAGRMDLYLNFAITWLHYISTIASPSCARHLNVYILLTDSKKYIPQNSNERIDQIHSNTAFTTSCSNENDIFIYRREEWLKVLFHETFHCLGLDFSAEPVEESNRRIIATFPALNRNTDIRLYESYCEMWAEIVNLMFCLFTTRSGKMRQFSKSVFLSALKKEQRFSIQQSNKLLKHADYRYNELFSAPAKNRKFYEENTNAFSYYVIKSILFLQIDEFVKWCLTNGEKSPLQFSTRSPESIVPRIPEFPTRSSASIVPRIPEFTTRSPSACASIVPFTPEFTTRSPSACASIVPRIPELSRVRIRDYCDLVERLATKNRYLNAAKRNKPGLNRTMRMTSIDPLWI